jgi:F-type H+-transporting ATPase subunit delta
VFTLKLARQYERSARQVFRFCLVGGKLDEGRARAVAQKLLTTKSHGYLLVLKRFLCLLKHEYAKHAAQVETAIPMPADLRDRVLNGLATRYGPAVTSSFVHNPDLIGGMRIKIGSDVYDGTVRSALARLARQFGLTSASPVGSTSG